MNYGEQQLKFMLSKSSLEQHSLVLQVFYNKMYQVNYHVSMNYGEQQLKFMLLKMLNTDR
jgi:hypothetical protein